MSSSNFISTSEWNTYINSAISQLLMLINANDADYGLTSATVAMNGTDQFFPVPTDFSQFRGLDLNWNQRKLTVPPFSFKERNKQWSFPYAVMSPYITPYQYRLQDNKIEIIPAPQSGDSFTIWYVPTATVLVNDTDTFNCNMGYDDWIVLTACINAHDKEESDTQVLFAERKRIEDMIITEIRRLDLANATPIWISSGTY